MSYVSSINLPTGRGRLAIPKQRASKPPLVRRCAWCGNPLLVTGAKANHLRNGYDTYAYCKDTDCQQLHRRKLLDEYKAQSWAAKKRKSTRL